MEAERRQAYPLPTMANPQMVKAVSHPTRVHALTVLNERSASPRELAAELDRTIRHVTYHLDELEKLACIELVETREVKGGKVKGENFYRGIQRPWFNRDAWKLVDPEDQPGVTSSIMALMNEDIANAITGGTINGKENHISRLPMIIDREGWEELVELLTETLRRGMAIQERAAVRLDSGADVILTKVHLIQFESPKPRSK